MSVLRLPKRSTFKNIQKVGRTIYIELRESRERERRWYPTRRHWSVRVYDRILRKLNWLPLPGRKRIVRARLAGVDRPFYVRLGSSDLQLHQTIRFRGEYDPLFEHAEDLGHVRTVVDLGANAGFTIRLWRDRFPGCRVIAVEPDADNREVCRLNVESIEAADDVTLIGACVDGKPGRVLLDRSGWEHHFHITDHDTGRCVSVEALTVPQVIERAGLAADEPIDLLKCDVQGAERAIFRDCAAWIGRVRNMVVELHDGYVPEEFIEDLDRAGWRPRRCVTHRTDQLWVVFLWGEPQRDAHAAPEAAAAPASAPAASTSASSPSSPPAATVLAAAVDVVSGAGPVATCVGA